ncbi:hypothetical protein [Thermosipho melanesiensis]|nr:hypothetical protein [Thermosipho melanesiensis]
MNLVLGNTHLFLDDFLAYLMYYSNGVIKYVILKSKPVFLILTKSM